MYIIALLILLIKELSVVVCLAYYAQQDGYHISSISFKNLNNITHTKISVNCRVSMIKLLNPQSLISHDSATIIRICH